MKNENEMIDSLLKEHAKMKKHGEVDEQFLKELEERIDAEDSGAENSVIVPMTQPSSNSAGSRWALGLGVAACAVFGYMGYQMWNDQKSDIVMNSGAGQEQIAEAHLAKERIASRSEISDADRARLFKNRKLKEEVRNDDVSRKPNSPSSRMAKRIAANSSNSNALPVPEMTLTEPSLDFGDGEDFGDGFVSKDNGRGIGGGLPLEGKYKEMNGKRRKGYLKGRQKSFREMHLLDSDEGRRAHLPKVNKAERYGELIENKFISPVDKDSKRSTFAVDVDTASYTNLRRMIQSNSQVPANAVRVEEMVNYFDYNYAQPNGDHPFAVHVDSAACPWNKDNKLVRIAIQGKDVIKDERPASNVVFLLDVSGSMNSHDKLPLLKQSLKYLLEELNEKDTVSIAVYAGASGLALPATHVTAEGRIAIMKSLDNLSAGGSTAGGQGIKLAYKLAKENFVKEGINRVILATDGDFNVGVSSTKALTKLVKEKAKSGVYLSVLGFGSGNINDDMMEAITNNGNGNYSYIDSIKEGRKVLLEDMMGTMMTIAKDVKVRVEFNPEKVKQYRLIGYANRVLPNAAFLDKTADAGEIGAGHTVTAFYEIVPGKATDKAALDDLRFAKKKEKIAEPELETEHADKLLFVDLAYKKPDQKINDESTYLSVPLKDEAADWDETDDNFKFASSVALFGMILRESDHKGNGDLKLVEKLAKEGMGNDGKGHRAEFLKLVKKLKARRP